MPAYVLMTSGDSPNHDAISFPKNICLKVTGCVTQAVVVARECAAVAAVVVVGLKSEFQINSFGETSYAIKCYSFFYSEVFIVSYVLFCF